MSAGNRESAAPSPVEDDEALAIIEHLDAENEHYMSVTMQLRDLLEEAVNREVAMEREVARLREQVDRLQGELAALHRTKLMRAVRPLRSLYRRWRARRA